MSSSVPINALAVDKQNPEQLKDVVIKDILRGLYEERYEPGQRITEAFLTSTFNLSRGPAREALNTLAAMNVVELSPGRGAHIRVLSIQDAIETLVVAKNLLGLAARLATENRENSEANKSLKRLTQVLEQLSSSENKGTAAFAKARDAFYGLITQMASNSELSRLLPTIQVHLIRVQFRHALRLPHGVRVKQYTRIAEAIQKGNARGAERAMHSHIESSISALQKFKRENSE